MTPAELVERIRAGDADAEDELVRTYGRGLSRILARSAHGEVADDLCQEALRLGLEKVRRGELREPERLPGYLASLARNLLIDHARKEKRRGTHVDVDAAPALVEEGGGPLEELLEKERAGIARRVLGELESERDREILRRFYLVGEEKAVLCAELGLSDLHFNCVLHRARERFRALYRRAAGPDPRDRDSGPRRLT